MLDTAALIQRGAYKKAACHAATRCHMVPLITLPMLPQAMLRYMLPLAALRHFSPFFFFAPHVAYFDAPAIMHAILRHDARRTYELRMLL